MIETKASPMYCMEPVFTLPDKLPRTNVMYEMKNIHDYRIATKIEQQVTSLLKVFSTFLSSLIVFFENKKTVDSFGDTHPRARFCIFEIHPFDVHVSFTKIVPTLN